MPILIMVARARHMVADADLLTSASHREGGRICVWKIGELKNYGELMREVRPCSEE